MPRDKSTTSKIMSSIKSKNTKPERHLGKAMWNLGLRYRKHYKIPGSPDFAFIRKKLAVFCDGDFWHGNNWRIRGLSNLDEELQSYSPYWRKKILDNIARDKRVNSLLTKQGWTVLRFWESEIKKAPYECANKAMRIYNSIE